MGKTTRRTKQAHAAENISPTASASPSSSTANSVSSAAEQLQRYEMRIHDLEVENRAYQKEIEVLKNKLGNVSITPDSVQRLKDGYLQKLNALEKQVKELKKKQDVQSQLSTCRRRNDEGMKHLHDEIQKLKAQKVQLQCQAKLDAVQFRLCKAALEKEILQLKKEGRRNEFEMQKLLALNQRQKMVLQRKNEETSMASNRLKNLLESRKVLLSRKTGTKKACPAGIQGIEHEFEVTSHINQICSEYEQQIEMMADEITRAKEEAELLKQENFRLLIQNKELDCREDPEMQDLKEDVVKLSNLLSQLKTQKLKLTFLEDAEEDLTQPSISAGSTSEYTDPPSTSELENSEEVALKGKKESATCCCSCSKKSLCKTMKCGCRAAGGSCGTSCGCSSAKCTNRAELLIKLEESADTGNTDGNLNLNLNSNPSENDAAEKSILDPEDPIPHGGPLLQPAETDDHCGLKKMPLYDIANTLIKSFASKHNQRRKARQ